MLNKNCYTKILDLTDLHEKLVTIVAGGSAQSFRCLVYDASASEEKDQKTGGIVEKWNKVGEPVPNDLTLDINPGLVTQLVKITDDCITRSEGPQKNTVKFFYYSILERLNGDSAQFLKTSGEITPSNFPFSGAKIEQVRRVLNRFPDPINTNCEAKVQL